MRHKKNRVATVVVLLIAGLSLSGCVTAKSKRLGYTGNVPDIDQKNLATFVEDQDAIALAFARLGGLSALPADGKDWRPVVDGGMLYVDARCERFMDALFWLNRARETSSHQIQYAGSAASAILAIANATKALIGIAPLGFGFADQTVNNIGQGLLYNLDPGDVAQMVARKQGTYRNLIKDTKFTQRSPAMNAIAQYAANCLPVRIEGDVNQAIAKSEFTRVDHRTPVETKTDKPPEIEPTPGEATPPVNPPEGVQDNESPVLEVSSPD